MTKLTGKLTRELGLTFEGRAIVIDLEAPGDITFREKGTKRAWTMPASAVMQMVITRIVENGRTAPKKVRRGLLGG